MQILTSTSYEWNTFASITTADFTNPLQQVEVLLTYFVPESSRSSGSVRIAFTQASGSQASSSALFVTLPSNEQQLNAILPPAASVVDRIFITLISGTVAIDKITFCSEPEG